MSGIYGQPKMTKSDAFHKSVATGTTDTKEVVIPAGEEWYVESFEGSAAYMDDTMVCVVWDYGGGEPEILAATHGDTRKIIDRTLTGDGVKVLAILLQNNTANSHVIGGSYRARQN